jgi:hypothetical protein
VLVVPAVFCMRLLRSHKLFQLHGSTVPGPPPITVRVPPQFSELWNSTDGTFPHGSWNPRRRAPVIQLSGKPRNPTSNAPTSRLRTTPQKQGPESTTQVPASQINQPHLILQLQNQECPLVDVLSELSDVGPPSVLHK